MTHWVLLLTSQREHQAALTSSPISTPECEDLYYIIDIIKQGGSPGLVVMGGDSHPTGHGF